MSWKPTHEQQKIINHDIDSHGRILAGPGTGKSATIIRMMLEMLKEGKGRCKLLTFTRSATNELKDKITELPEGLESPSTVHSFAISVLLKNEGVSRLPEPIRIADDWEWKYLIREHLKELVDCNVRVIDRARDEMASNWQSMEPTIDPDLPDNIRNRFTGIWEQHRTLFGYSLLAELPYRLLHALQDHPDMKLEDWKLIIVDEYQDLNQCDLSVLKEITRWNQCILAVGDDDQSIYSFRLAHPIGIQRFLGDYPGAIDYTLSVSQRCGSLITRWANHVIEGLPNRPERPALTPASHCSLGTIRYLRFDNWNQEIKGVARIVSWIIESKRIKPEEIVILFRTNHNHTWSKPIIEVFGDANIKVVNPDIVSSMLAESSNRRMLAIARLVVNQEDSLAWWTLFELTNGIGPRVRDHFYERANATNSTFGTQVFTEYLEEFSTIPATKKRELLINTMTPILDLINEINESNIELGKGGWGNWLAEQAEVLGGCKDDFKTLLIDLDSVIDRKEGFGRFLGQIQPAGKDIRSGRDAGAVRLMTMMSSKGLTVRAAIIVGAEDGVIPLAKRDKEEERRLLYVAMTRSTDYLYITWSRRRIGPTARTGAPNVGQRRNPSPFLTHGSVRSEPGNNYLSSLDV